MDMSFGNKIFAGRPETVAGKCGRPLKVATDGKRTFSSGERSRHPGPIRGASVWKFGIDAFDSRL